MKRKYEKPAVYIEELSMMQQIASCGAGSSGGDNPFGTPTQGDPSTCGFRLEGFGTIIFVSGVSGCEEIIDGSDESYGVCYNTYNPAYTMFTS